MSALACAEIGISSRYSGGKPPRRGPAGRTASRSLPHVSLSKKWPLRRPSAGVEAAVRLVVLDEAVEIDADPGEQLSRRLVVAQRRLDVEGAAVQRQQLAVDDELVALGVAAEVVVVVEHQHAGVHGRRWRRSSRPRPARSTRRRPRPGRRSRRCASPRRGRARGRRAAGATPRTSRHGCRACRCGAADSRRRRPCPAACASSASAQLHFGSSDAPSATAAPLTKSRRLIGRPIPRSRSMPFIESPLLPDERVDYRRRRRIVPTRRT